MATVHHLLGTVLSWDRTCETTDGQLLLDYTRRHDATALAALVRRHGSMVWNVCRRTLGDHHDAEDVRIVALFSDRPRAGLGGSRSHSCSSIAIGHEGSR